LKVKTRADQGRRKVVAKCCGRRTTGDMVLDLSALPEHTRKMLGLGEELCDGCRERLFLEGRIGREAFYALLREHA
jgi:hypothetical protein